MVLPAAKASAEQATTTSAVNLRSGASTSSVVVGRITAGIPVQVSHCSAWCEVEWQGKKGFAIAIAFDRRGPGTLRSPNAAAVADDNPVPMSLPKVSESPQRNEGPFVKGAGPGWGFGWLGYRGRW
jgi:uncharacterized protein YraI